MNSKPHLDDPLDHLNFSSKRTLNALIRGGIFTPRLLLMYTRDMLFDIRNLGEKGLQDIEQTLSQWDWTLADKADFSRVFLWRKLALTFRYYTNRPLDLNTIIWWVQQEDAFKEKDVLRALEEHPYIMQKQEGTYVYVILKQDVPVTNAVSSVSSPSAKIKRQDDKILLHTLWHDWLTDLDERQRRLLNLRYGLQENDPLTLKEVSHQLETNISRERVRQIEGDTLRVLGSQNKKEYWQALKQLLITATKQAGGLVTVEQWENYLNKQTVWYGDDPRPFLLRLLCALFDDFHFIDSSYQVATFNYITSEHLYALSQCTKKILKPLKTSGLTVDLLLKEIAHTLTDDIPNEVRESAFILSALTLFDRIEQTGNRYFYAKKKKRARYSSVESGWAGKQGTRLHEWELELRQQFETVAWIGQIDFSETNFHALCQAIQKDAKKGEKIRPHLIPSAVFVVTMVFTVRYSNQDTYEFWTPYLRTVWNVEDTTNSRRYCRERFATVVPYLEKTFDFEFPRQTKGTVVRPIFRHALIPCYLQDNFAQWLGKKWENILHVADSPSLLDMWLQQDTNIEDLPRRLQKFVSGSDTTETARILIINIAEGIRLYVHEGQSIEEISLWLTGSPIEQEVWQEVACVLTKEIEDKSKEIRVLPPRIEWVWSLEEEEMVLQVRRIILPAYTSFMGEPDRLVWIENSDDAPEDSEIEVEVKLWRMTTGELLINELFIPELKKDEGHLILLTTEDEEIQRLTVPNLPSNKIQFFRLTQQEAYGVPVAQEKISQGTWLVCAQKEIIFLDEQEDAIELDFPLPPPYPLNKIYNWAGQITLTLPVTLQQDNNTVGRLIASTTQLTIGQPKLKGQSEVKGLSNQVQPTFTDNRITLSITGVQDRFLKQTSLQIRGQNGCYFQRSLSQLHQEGIVQVVQRELLLDLEQLMPAEPPNFYILEMRQGLQRVFSAPLEFAIVPNLSVAPFDHAKIYTPQNPFQVKLFDIDESNIVPRQDIKIEPMADGRIQVTWQDLRRSPHLILQFGKIEIPLAWSVPRVTVWLTPSPQHDFLTLDELKKATLWLSTNQKEVEVAISIGDEYRRSYSLKWGRHRIVIENDQLWETIRLTKSQQFPIHIYIEESHWLLCEVRKRPQLSMEQVRYDAKVQVIHLQTRLSEPWVGQVRFVAESVTNPFASVIELGEVNQLEGEHTLPASEFNAGIYLLRIALDDAWLSLNENTMRFMVGNITNELGLNYELVRAIRKGESIRKEWEEDFVLWWAELAEEEEADLTTTTLYQLATLSAHALENFGVTHLQKLWSPLAQLKEVYGKWQEQYLPAWVFYPCPIILKTIPNGLQLSIYPIQTKIGGETGTGYARLRMFFDKKKPKEWVYMAWQYTGDRQIQLEAGLPAEPENLDWTKMDILDTYALFYCPVCGRLTGASSMTLPAEIKQEHIHNQRKDNLKDITMPAKKGGHQLLVDIILSRRGQTLLDIYHEHDTLIPSTQTYMAEPTLPKTPFPHQKKLMTLVREIKRYGANSHSFSVWASAERLLTQWQEEEQVTELGQGIFALAFILRTVAYKPKDFTKLRKNISWSESDVQKLLEAVNQHTIVHLEWGLTWAELLYVHHFKQGQ